MSLLQKTSDYSIFKKIEYNRDIDELNLKKIINSIQACNMLQYRPILVDKNMYVIDGQHRLRAAEFLNVEIYYQISAETTPQDIILLNSNQKTWSIGDYVNYYMNQGFEEYRKLYEFCKAKKITYASLLKTAPVQLQDSYPAVRSGRYKFLCTEDEIAFIDSLEKTEQALYTMNTYVVGNKLFLKSMGLKYALIRLTRHPDFDLKNFLNKLMLKAEAIRKCTSVLAYFDMFKSIYNWKNQNPLE